MRFGTSRECLPINVQLVERLAGGDDPLARRLSAGGGELGSRAASKPLTGATEAEDLSGSGLLGW